MSPRISRTLEPVHRVVKATETPSGLGMRGGLKGLKISGGKAKKIVLKQLQIGEESCLEVAPSLLS